MHHVGALVNLQSVALPVQLMQQCWLQSPRQVTPAQHMVLPSRKRCLCVQAAVRSCSHAASCSSAGHRVVRLTQLPPPADLRLR